MNETVAPKRSYALLVVFLAVVALAASSGVMFRPGEWYAALAKPPWTPPDWVFGPVWAVLYVFIAIAGWIIFSLPGTRLARGLWVAQLALNALWSFLFFGLQSTWLALADIVALMVCISFLMYVADTVSRTAMWLLAPYLAWVGYAFTLNAAIVLGNPH